METSNVVYQPMLFQWPIDIAWETYHHHSFSHSLTPAVF